MSRSSPIMKKETVNDKRDSPGLLKSLNLYIRIFLYIVIITVMGNMSALLDKFLHPEIPYFDPEHLVIGGILAFLTTIICAMIESNMRISKKNFQSTSLVPFTWFLVTTWTMVIFASLTWDIYRQKQATYEVAVHEARTVFEKDLNYYRWATGHDGVFVPITDKTQPNPYLAHIPEYKIRTEKGRKLTLVNPEYMIRQVYEMQTTTSGALGHITSLDPIRPGNEADPWEARALAAFEKGETEVVEITEINKMPYLRLMRPMITEKGCLKCHAAQGYEVGDIRGGVSVSIPLYHLYDISVKDIVTFTVGHIGLWILGLLGIIVGFSRIRQSMMESEEAEARTKAIIDNMFDGLITFEEDGTIASLNAVAAKMFRYKDREAVGEKISKLIVIPGLPVNASGKMLHGEINRLAGSSKEMVGRQADNSSFPVQISISRMMFGPQPLYIAMVRDITEEKIRKAEAMQAGKLAAIGELAAGVAHEINNPINGVINYAQILHDQMEEESRPEEQEMLGRVLKEGDRVATIVRNLLSFARQRDEETNDVAMKEIIDDSISLLKHQFNKDGIQLVVEVQSDMPFIKGNPQQLQQVLLNLFSNARYALNERYPTPNPAKRIEIKSSVVHLGKDYIRTTVTDFGYGIANEVIDKIFDSLFSTKPPGEGTGLGLSISRDLVNAHHGHLHVDTVINDHTTATVDLPVPEE